MTINLSNISSATLRRVIAIKDQIESLTGQLTSLLSGQSAPAAKSGRRTMSSAARAKIGAAQRARWAKTKKAAPAAKAVAGKKRRKMSAAGRARIAASAKARWAKVKAAGKTSL